MVEIKHHPDPTPEVHDNAKYRLVYAKSKVYVNPTAYARDNIPGFAAIVKREAFTSTYLLAWIPEALLTEKGPAEWDKFLQTEERHISQEDEDEDGVLIDLPTSRPESYAFSVPLTSLYSLIVHPPSLSTWYGSIGINLISGATLPTLYFHDDESRSFTMSPKAATPGSSPSTSYPPPSIASQASTSRATTSWGGEDLLARLRSYSSLLRSTLQTTLYLVDPSKADIEAHTTQLFSDDAVDEILARSSYANSHSPVPSHRRPRPLSASSSSTQNPYSSHSSILHRSMPQPLSSSPATSSQARTALLQSFANITRATRHAAQNILSHPLAKPIVPHLPDPVKSLVNASGDLEWGSWVEKGGVGEFESARVYLARWARIVAEEGERARRREAQAIPAAGAVTEETSELGIFELLQSTANLPTPKSSRDPKHPVDIETFESWFAADGRPTISAEKMRQEIFRRGVSDTYNARKKVWPFLLGVYEWDVTEQVRQVRWEEKMQQYHDIKDEWFGKPEVFDRPDVLEERHRIDVDCRRTDRTQSLFASQPTPSTSDPDPEKERHRRYSTISPSPNEIGAQSPSNEHIDRLASILLTYNFYEKKLGYVQGMSDLCAPIYVAMGSDEVMTFWCFVEVMDRMKQNFLRDQSGMKKQLSTLQQLIEVMDPELFRHLEKTDGLNLFFCFRWILISFKREFPFEDVLRLWEVLWTDFYTNEFFDEILKYCNELSMTIELDTTLAQAEVLFLSFSQLVADMDRRRAELALPSAPNGLRQRAGAPQAKVAAIPDLSEELRGLLKAGRSV
ncbi:RabGAP/TBC [Artomyces pyxidatus]|uniref:RabGAP/TBC n=1 Tax=Artomyces pyxidatus TaxID=48021 RepID=A0ACB8T8V2_9AGAM|nr:RabGAP/TBC [Artomyces pyxidatus]